MIHLCTDFAVFSKRKEKNLHQDLTDSQMYIYTVFMVNILKLEDQKRKSSPTLLDMQNTHRL